MRRADGRTDGRAESRAMRWRRLGGLVALQSACAFAPLPAQVGIALGSPAPAVTVNDLDGTPFDFTSIIGKKPVLIQFWATWCELCERLEPKVRAAAAKYGKDVEFIGVNVTVNQKPDRVRRWLEEHKPAFRTLWDNRGVAVRAYDVPSTSFIAIVDARGKVAYTGVGADQDIEGALRKVVGR